MMTSIETKRGGGARFLLIAWLAGVAVLAIQITSAPACPFCTAEAQTLSEETQSADVVVLARLIKEADQSKAADLAPGEYDPSAGTATFEVVEALRGGEALAGVKEFQAVYFGEFDRSKQFLISGISGDRIDWMTPLPLSAASVEYVRKLGTVPAAGVERLAFFQEYLEHEDPLLAQDAYDEFARAPYGDLHELKPRIHHERLVKWISDPETSPSRRRLYFTMLGVCGSEKDLPLLESMLASDFQTMKPAIEQLVHTALVMGAPVATPVWIDMVDQDERRKKLGLDALVACYLTLRGPEGLNLIDDRFLKNDSTEYTYIYSTIMALRFLGEEPTSQVPRDRVLASMRLLLNNSEFADQVIPDLARWEDWTVLDRLVSMFKSSDKNGYVRQPVVTYLTVAGEQEGDVGKRAQTALAELEKLDPDGVKQARSLMAFGALSRARAKPADAAPVATEAVGAAAKGGAPQADDGTEAFAASAAEMKAAEEATAADFPDPDGFAKSQPPEETSAAPAPTAEPADAPKVATPTAPSEQAPPQKSAAANAVMPQSHEAAGLNPSLAIGVPLGAAVVLMGVYWAILRAGAV